MHTSVLKNVCAVRELHTTLAAAYIAFIVLQYSSTTFLTNNNFYAVVAHVPQGVSQSNVGGVTRPHIHSHVTLMGSYCAPCIAKW